MYTCEWEYSRVATYVEVTGVFSTCSEAYLCVQFLLYLPLLHSSCWSVKKEKI